MRIPVSNHLLTAVVFVLKHLKRDLSETERRVEELMDLRKEEQVSTAELFI